MTARARTATVRIGVLVAVVCSVAVAPAAQAVTPPAIDLAMLPPALPPGPPGPTERSGSCADGPAGALRDGADAALAAGAGLGPVWALTRGAGQTVAVIDTGVAPHRLLPRLRPGGDFVSTGDGMQDCDGHGTAVAGIIAASPSGTADPGIAPDATILAIRQSSNAFRSTAPNSSAGVGDVDSLARAVRGAADAGATVINVSTVACLAAGPGIDDRPLGAALAYAVDVKNVVVVAAAGNVGGGGCAEQNPGPDPARSPGPDWDGVTVVVSPPWYDDYVLTVGSVDAAGAPSPFTLGGPWVDVAARGERVLSLAVDGESLTDAAAGPGRRPPLSGTSYAAPVVAALAALVRSRFPTMTARQVMARIEATAHSPAAGWDPLVGRGVVDPLAAVGDGGPPVSGVASHSAAFHPPGPPAGEHADRGTARRVALAGGAGCVALATAGTAFAARRRSEPGN